jgi:hypothetical protein
MAIAAHLMIFGERAGLPGPLQRVEVPVSIIRAAFRVISGPLSWLESITHPRWERLVRQQRLIGAACLFLALVLELPLPLVNLVPAVCLATIALGGVQRDGVLVALGLIATVLLAGALSWAAIALAGTAVPMLAW